VRHEVPRLRGLWPFARDDRVCLFYDGLLFLLGFYSGSLRSRASVSVFIVIVGRGLAIDICEVFDYLVKYRK